MEVFQKLKERLVEPTSNEMASEKESVESELSRESELESEVRRLRDVVNANYEVYVRKLEKRKERMRELEKSLKDVHQDNDKLRKEAGELEQRLSACRDSVDELEGFRTQETAKLKHMLLSTENRLQIEEERNGQLQLQIDQLLKSNKDNLDEKQTSSVDVEEDKVSFLSASLSESLSSVVSERDALKNSLLDVELRLHELQETSSNERSNHQLEMSKLKTQMETMEVTLGIRENEIKNKTSDYRNHIDRLQAQNNEAMELNGSQCSRIASLEAELAMLKQQLKEANDNHSVLTSLHDDLRNHNDALLLKGRELETECRDLKVNYNELLEQQGVKSETILNLESKLRSMEGQKEDLEDHKRSLESSIEDVGRQLQRSNDENTQLHLNLKELQDTLKHMEDSFESRMEASQLVQTLREGKQLLEDELNDCKKLNRVHQQRLDDVKKTLQKELREASSNNNLNMSEMESVSPMSFVSNVEDQGEEERERMSEVNFKYLKHVILKFLTSKEYEAKHLTRAIGALLKLSREEERLLAEHLEWKSSWFGVKPDLGKGQFALSIDHQ